MTPFTSTSTSTTTGTNCLHRLYDINYNKPININALRNFKFPLSNFKLTDKAPPVITLVGANPLYIEWTTSAAAATYADPGATAYDEYDGEIPSSNIVVNSSAVIMSALGSYPVIYNVSDSSGHAAQVTRTVIVRDTTAPVITLVGQSSLYIEWTSGATYSDAGATASDNKDGDITSRITVGNNVNLAALGTYTVTYNVSDSSGNRATQVTRTVTVRDTTRPTITLVGANPLYIEWSATPQAYVDPGATASDNYDGTIPSSNIAINSYAVQTGTIGTYTVTYNVFDSSGNAAAPVTRTVIVRDTTRPTITLNRTDLNPLYVQHNTSYSDPGATALDNKDGNISNSITTVSNVNIAVLGNNYTVTYNVSDSSGNAAIPVTRNVRVVNI